MTVLRSREIVPMVKSQSPLKTLRRGGTIESSKTLEPSNLAASTPKALGFCSDSPVSLSGNVRRRSLRLASIQSGVHEITTPTPAVTVTSIINQDAEKGTGKRKLASEGSLSLRSGKKICKRTSSIEGSTCDDGDKSVHHVNNQRGVEISVVSNTVNLLEHVVGLNELDNDPTSDETGTAGIKATRRLSRVEKGKGKAVNDDLLSNDNTVLDTAAHLPENVGLKELEKDPIADGNCNGKPRKRLTREEKGKRKVVEDGLLSNGIEALELNLETQAGDSEKNAVSGTRSLADGQDGSPVVETNMDNFPRARDYKERFRDIARQNASRFAHFSSEEVEENRVTNEAEGEMPGREGDREIEDWPGPFSTAMKIIKDREMNANVPQQSSCLDERKPAPVMWAPKKDQHSDRSKLLIPPLQDLCIAILAKNADAITSLESVPDVLKHKLSQLLCDSRRMNSHFLDLLVRGSPTEIRIRDCSWLTEEQLLSAFKGCEINNLTVLQLDQCGRCMPDYVLVAILARMSNILPALTTISLKGACRLSDVGLSALVGSAPALRSINLSQCSLLTSDGINTLADSLGYVLRELYIDDCQNIDTMLILPALSKLEHLEVLSLAGIQTVCDDFVIKFIAVHGHNIKELVLTDCGKLTDSSMKVIADTCTGLCVLDLGNLCRLTDSAMGYLANGCRAIQTLKLCRNSFSDEAVAAYLEASGESLKELSLNNVNKVSNNTAISLARRSRKLFTLDLSWCRNLTNEAVGLIVDSCLSLKVLKLFGCTQITNVFLDGYSNPEVQIIGLKMTPILEHLKVPDPVEGLLRYSSVPS